MFPIVVAGEDIPSLPAFIIGRNGIYLRKESALGISQARVPNIAHLPDVQPELEYKLPPIPKKLSAQIAGFLLKVDRELKGEGAVLLCLDKKRKWQIVIPPQDNSGYDVKYRVEPDTVPDGWLLAGTVHSHPFMKGAPTASYTDESDERKIDGVHLVAGSLDHNPKYGAAVVVDGTRFVWAEWEQLIEPAEPVDVPDEWLAKVEKKKSFSDSVGKWVGGLWTGGSSSYSYTSKPWVPEWYPREGETVEQGFARGKKSSLSWLIEDAAKLGMAFRWSLVPLPEGHSDVDEPVTGSTTVGQTVKVGETTTVEGMQLTVLPDKESPASEWADIDPLECTDKHPYKDCPANCGCHCKNCRLGLVGAFDASEVNQPTNGRGKVLCKCTKCWKGCDEDQPMMMSATSPDLCMSCDDGYHYRDHSKAGEAW